eukprot:7506581-Pyramimonas_sp.AAC.1
MEGEEEEEEGWAGTEEGRGMTREAGRGKEERNRVNSRVSAGGFTLLALVAALARRAIRRRGGG